MKIYAFQLLIYNFCDIITVYYFVYKIQLKNGESPESPLLGDGKYCGTTVPETLMTTGNKLFVKTVGTGTHVSFKLEYR